jgi:Lrp/AsnC family transcriptional regulator for asnA, asnC and gidA
MKLIIDDLDQQIVKLLMTDGRMSCSDIARSIGHVSPRTVRYRIDRLVEKEIIAIRPIVSAKALGYGIAADIFVQVEPKRVEAVAEACVKMDEVNYVAITSGDRDVAIQVFVADVSHLHTFITKTLQAVPGVEQTKTYLLIDVLKDIDSWGIPSKLPHSDSE